jgi:hypothetical protein
MLHIRSSVKTKDLKTCEPFYLYNILAGVKELEHSAWLR